MKAFLLCFLVLAVALATTTTYNNRIALERGKKNTLVFACGAVDKTGKTGLYRENYTYTITGQPKWLVARGDTLDGTVPATTVGDYPISVAYRSPDGRKKGTETFTLSCLNEQGSSTSAPKPSGGFGIIGALVGGFFGFTKAVLGTFLKVGDQMFQPQVGKYTIVCPRLAATEAQPQKIYFPTNPAPVKSSSPAPAATTKPVTSTTPPKSTTTTVAPTKTTVVTTTTHSTSTTSGSGTTGSTTGSTGYTGASGTATAGTAIGIVTATTGGSVTTGGSASVGSTTGSTGSTTSTSTGGNIPVTPTDPAPVDPVPLVDPVPVDPVPVDPVPVDPVPVDPVPVDPVPVDPVPVDPVPVAPVDPVPVDPVPAVDPVPVDPVPVDPVPVAPVDPVPVDPVPVDPIPVAAPVPVPTQTTPVKTSTPAPTPVPTPTPSPSSTHATPTPVHSTSTPKTTVVVSHTTENHSTQTHTGTSGPITSGSTKSESTRSESTISIALKSGSNTPTKTGNGGVVSAPIVTDYSCDTNTSAGVKMTGIVTLVNKDYFVLDGKHTISLGKCTQRSFPKTRQSFNVKDKVTISGWVGRDQKTWARTATCSCQ